MRFKRRSSPGGTGIFSTAASLDLPVGPRIEPGDVRGYYIDFTSKAIDASWPPPWLAERKEQLHVGTWQWGLGCYERHLAGDGDRWLDAAVKTATHAVSLQEPDGGWPHFYAMPHTYRLDPPWLSAMAQGEGASLLIRAHQATGEERFASAARRALAPMDLPLDEGGVRTTLNGSPFLEEYPTLPGSYVLNGAIFALWGYYDVGCALGDDEALNAFEQLADGLAAEIHRFDSGYWSLYDLYPHPIANVASAAYHQLHINQLIALNTIAPRPEFKATVSRFESYESKRANTLRTLVKKTGFRLLIPRNAMFANKLPYPRKRDNSGRPVARLRPRNDRLALCYHAISDDWPAGLAVTPERLERQLTEVLDAGYTPTTFHDLVYGEREGRLVAITFDDGFGSVFERARPILERLGIIASLFVTTGYVGGVDPASWAGVEGWIGGRYEDELTPMSWEQIRALADAGWEIGSHTVNHPRLPTLDDELLEQELRRSKQDCERELGVTCRSLAYPYGAYDGRVVAAARRAGYTAGCTLPHRLHNASPLRWPRIGVYHGDDMRRFNLKTSALLRALRSSPAWSAIDALRGAAPESPAS